MGFSLFVAASLVGWFGLICFVFRLIAVVFRSWVCVVCIVMLTLVLCLGVGLCFAFVWFGWFVGLIWRCGISCFVSFACLDPCCDDWWWECVCLFVFAWVVWLIVGCYDCLFDTLRACLVCDWLLWCWCLFWCFLLFSLALAVLLLILAYIWF